MGDIEIDQLYERLYAQLAPHVRSRIDMKIVGPSGLSIKIDGDNCLSSIGVWPNGCCDVDYLYVSSERGEFKHFEFENTDAAFPIVFHEINLAVERA